MCGIAGLIHRDGSGNIGQEMTQMLMALKHRGPDQQGVWESNHVSLGAVRLKIIDLIHGEQPMSLATP